jgi:hypothetical protein
MHSFFRISLLNWIGHVNTMNSKRKVSQVCNNERQGSRVRRRSYNGFWNCLLADTNKCKITNWIEIKKTAN